MIDDGDERDDESGETRVYWRRRSISLSRETYEKLVAYALARGEKMSTIIEKWIAESLGECTPTLALLTKQRDDARKYAATLWVICNGDNPGTGRGLQMAWDQYAKRWGATEAMRVYGARPRPGQVDTIGGVRPQHGRGSSSPTPRAARA